MRPLPERVDRKAMNATTPNMTMKMMKLIHENASIACSWLQCANAGLLHENSPPSDVSADAAAETQKIHRMKENASTEMSEAMIDVPRNRMKKMKAPPTKMLNIEVKSVNLVTFLRSVDG